MDDLRFYRRKLPHFQPEEVTFAVTFRLAGSLPKAVIERLKLERTEALKAIDQREKLLKKELEKGKAFDLIKQLEEERLKVANLYSGKFNHLLDFAETGPTWLAQPEIATVIQASIHYLQDERKMYQLWAYCIMPNHVHLIISDVNPVLHQVLKRLKQYTARKANLILKRTGNSFWQKESYDRIIRNEEEFQHQLAYVLNNPVKAGLVDHWQDWAFSYSAV